jgi:hypothetical protein
VILTVPLNGCPVIAGREAEFANRVLPAEMQGSKEIHNPYQ